MKDRIKKYWPFAVRMAGFIVVLTLLIFATVMVVTKRCRLADLVETFVTIVCCTFFCSILLRGLYERISRYPRVLFFLSFMGLSTLGVGTGAAAALLIITGKLVFHIHFLISILIGLFLSAGITFYEVQKSRLEENAARLKEAELEVERLKRLESEARFTSLQAKLHPHFLFNTLNSLAALVMENPRRAEKGIVRLSELYRRILSVSDRTFVSVEDELELIRDNLELEKLRFEDGLTYRFDCPSSLRRRKIPGFLIEPLVGNVVKHVLGRKAGAVNITVRIRSSRGRLLISVSDNGPGFNPDLSKVGYGLKSVAQRLRLLFGEEGDLAVRSKEGEGTTVTVRIPVGRKVTEGYPWNDR